MSERPPRELVATLERLGLASASQVARLGRRVRRLALDLPGFDSVWIDALAQTRVLTPYQAAELNAARGESLRVGPYLLCERLPHPLYVACYRARNIETQEMVRLAVVENVDPSAKDTQQRLMASGLAYPGATAAVQDTVGQTRVDHGIPLARPSSPAPRPLSTPMTIAEPWIDGRTVAEWMVHHGRFSPAAVLHIARAMVAALVELENRGRCHGDLSLFSLIVTDVGDVALMLPGLRGILRPQEGYAHADLPPEAYDTLAPERVTQGTPPNAASDIYACGCMWWHMLCGRPPLAGGDSLAKLRAAQAGEIGDLRRYVVGVPEPLEAVISACLQRDPSGRPESMMQLAAMLGPPTQTGKEALVDCLARTGRPTVRWSTTVRRVRKSSRTPLWMAGVACCVATLVALLWPVWHGRTATETKVAIAQKSARPQNTRKAAKRGNSLAEPRARSQVVEDVAHQRRESTHVDAAITPASYLASDFKPEDLVLSSERPLELASLSVQNAQTVRAAAGRRAIVLVPRSGLMLDKNNVQFENIDFVWRDSSRNDRHQQNNAAIIQLRAGQAEFRGCSFRRSGAVPADVRAIHWIHPAVPSQADTSLPSGCVRLTDCFVQGMAAGIDCQTIGAVRIEVTNTLHLDSGPLVRLDHCPEPDETVVLNVSQVTLRGGGPLLECRTRASAAKTGEIAILATACVFAPNEGESLLRVTGESLVDGLRNALRWTGQGSLVTPRTPILACRSAGGQEQPADETSLSIAGLVRSEVRFAGETSEAAANRIVDWQAPLQSANPPGVTPEALPAIGVRPF